MIPSLRLIPAIRPVDAPQGSAVALCYFDGVHLGHRAVIGAAVRAAGRSSLCPAVFTFELPAGNTLKGGRILSPAIKHARMKALGVHRVMEPPFTEFCNLSPEQFVDEVLVRCLNARAVFCGDNFTFGAQAAGDVPRLQALCAARGIAVHVVDMAEYAGKTVSSTRIRAAL